MAFEFGSIDGIARMRFVEGEGYESAIGREGLAEATVEVFIEAMGIFECHLIGDENRDEKGEKAQAYKGESEAQGAAKKEEEAGKTKRHAVMIARRF